ncbi:hypothetical protein GCM10020227_32060 [Streptomyces flavovirens]
MRALTCPVERVYPVGVGMPSDICTPMVAGIRHGARPVPRGADTGPAEARLERGRVVLAEAMVAMTRAVAPASARGRRQLRIRWRGWCMRLAFGLRGSRPAPGCALAISL